MIHPHCTSGSRGSRPILSYLISSRLQGDGVRQATPKRPSVSWHVSTDYEILEMSTFPIIASLCQMEI